MARRIVPALLGILLTGFLAAGCTNDPISPSTQFTMTAKNLPPLAGEGYYELWLSYPSGSTQQKGNSIDHGNASYFSAGKFDVDASGAVISLTGGAAQFTIPASRNTQLLADAIITVEKIGSADSTPGARVLAGAVTGTDQVGKATLTLDYDDAFGEAITSDSSGFFSLVAPTSDTPADAVSGIWFVKFNAGSAIDTTAGLQLPAQPLSDENPDWTYQAWLVHNEGTAQVEYIKLGRFAVPNAPDSNGAGPGAGANPTRIFNAPGEDFVQGTKRFLNDGTYGVVVSQEPINVPLSHPLVIMLKADKIANGEPAGTAIPMFRPADLPSAEFQFDR